VAEGPGFVTRVGLALVDPRQAFAVAEASRGKAGLSDATLLLVLKLVCLETRALVIAAWSAISVGLGTGLSVLGSRLVGALGLDLAALVGSGLVIWLASGRRRQLSRDLDLAAVAWTPMFVLHVVAALAIAALDLEPPRLVTDGLGLAALALTAVWTVRAIVWSRGRDPS
jgi:hypothetical protein